MEPTKSDGNCIQNHQNNNEIHTGLYVPCEKIKIVIDVARRPLQQFSTRAVSGPPLPSGICEILLQAVHDPTKNVNFNDSQGFLENYLDMVKEFRPNFFFEKKPQVIDLVDEDDCSAALEDVVENKSASVIIVDESFDKTDFEGKREKSAHVDVIDVCEGTGGFQKSQSPSTDNQQNKEEAGRSGFVKDSYISIVDDDSEQKSSKVQGNSGLSDKIIVIDIADETDSKCMHLENIGSSEHNQELNIGTVKRKKSFGSVNIEDDDVIVLDDSFEKPKRCKPNLWQRFHQDVQNRTVATEGDSKTVAASSSKNNWVDLFTRGYTNNPTCSSKMDSFLPNNFHSNFPSIIDNSSNHNSNQSDSQEIVATHITVPNSANKPSKFPYRRPAHLNVPLTQTVVDSANTSSESSSGMSNIYNPNANLQEKRTGLRPVVIDGNNVGVSHGKGQFSVKGIQICINYFEKRGHRQIKAFIPHYRKRRDVHDILEKMQQQGTVVITPSRRVEGKLLAPYDDRYIVQYAAEVGGVIVTTDNYRDLLEENPSWKHTIHNRLLMFSWIDDLLMFPQDPMGRNGPSLNDFLKFPD